MNSRAYRLLRHYGMAIGSTAIALLLTLWLEPLMTRTIGGFFYIAIIVSTWCGGIFPGLTSIALSLLAINYFFVPPLRQFWGTAPDDLVRLFIFAIVAFIINLLSYNLRESKRKVEMLSRRLQEESSDRLKAALDAAQMGLWSWNIVTGEITWSPEHEQLLGLPPGSFDGRYETFEACLHPDDREGLNQAIAHSLNNRVPYDRELRVVWADGSVHWIEDRGQAFYGDDGQPVRMSGTIMAIDQRKQAQLLLQQQLEQQRLVMEMTNRIRQSLNLQEILQTTVDEVRQFLQVDRVILFQFASDWVGTVTVESVVAKEFSILPFKIYDPCIGSTYVEPFQQGLVTAKADIYAADINPCHVEFLEQFQVRANLVVPILKNGVLWGLLAAHHCKAPRQWQDAEINLLRQLTAQASIALQQADLFEQVQIELVERERAEIELRDRERLFSTLAEALPVVIFRFDQNSHCVYINNYWTILTGRTIESVAGLGWVETLHPQDRDRLTHDWLEWTQNSQQRGLYRNEGRLVHINGQDIWCYIQALPEVNTTGEIIGYIGVFTDISDRKQAEASLQQSEARLRLAQTASNSAAWDWDVQKNALFWSPEYYQLYELDPTIEPKYENWLACIHPDDRERVSQQTLQALEDESSELRIEFQVLRSDGVRWFAGIGQVLHDQAGQPARMIGITIDITQQKQTEIALQQFNLELEQRVAERTEELAKLNNRLLIALKEQHQAKQDVEDLYNNAPCGYHSLDAEGTIVRINNTELQWLGYTREEVLNQIKFIDLLTADSQVVFRQNFPEFIQRGWVNNLEFQLLHKDGSTRWISVNGTAINDDAGSFVMSRSSLFDISERKRSEAERKKVEQALALQAVITRNMAEGICLVRADDATIVYANPKFEQMFGYDTGELHSQHVAILNYPNEAVTAEDVYQSIRAAVLQNREFTYEVHSIKKDGTPFWCSATCSVFKHPEYGDVLVAVQQDISERRKIDQMKQEFISVVSHELRTPLTSIRGSLGLIAGGVYDKKPEKMKEMIAIAARQSDRLVRLVNDILNLRRLESGQSQFKFQHCSAADLIQQSVDVMHAQAEENQITLSIIPTTAEVWADADAIVQTLTNLLSNAIKFSPPYSTITVTAIPSGPSAFTRFSIQDQGRGIPADQLEAIFGQFQQVDASDSREKGGTGLGLAICRTIVKQHKGKIWVESVLTQGSTFYFTLPSTQILSGNA